MYPNPHSSAKTTIAMWHPIQDDSSQEFLPRDNSFKDLCNFNEFNALVVQRLREEKKELQDEVLRLKDENKDLKNENEKLKKVIKILKERGARFLEFARAAREKFITFKKESNQISKKKLPLVPKCIQKPNSKIQERQAVRTCISEILKKRTMKNISSYSSMEISTMISYQSKKIEEHLYASAKRLDEYMDSETIETRVLNFIQFENAQHTQAKKSYHPSDEIYVMIDLTE